MNAFHSRAQVYRRARRRSAAKTLRDKRSAAVNAIERGRKLFRCRVAFVLRPIQAVATKIVFARLVERVNDFVSAGDLRRLGSTARALWERARTGVPLTADPDALADRFEIHVPLCEIVRAEGIVPPSRAAREVGR